MITNQESPRRSIDIHAHITPQCFWQATEGKGDWHTLDEPEFLPFWKAAEQLGALILFHQGGETIVSSRINHYHLPNTIGNLVDRTVTFASLIFGGVMDA